MADRTALRQKVREWVEKITTPVEERVEERAAAERSALAEESDKA